MKRRSERELAQVIGSSLSTLMDYATTSLQEKRRLAWNYYLARPRGDELTGRSQVQSTMIRDHHHALMATIMPSYSGDHLIAFEPMGEDDEDAAQAESSAVNNIFTEDNSGYVELTNAVSESLLFGNGVVKVWISEETERRTLRYAPDAPLDQAGAGLEAEGWTVDHIEQTETEGTVQVSRETQKLEVKSVESARYFVDPNADSQDIQRHTIMAEATTFMRSELVNLGVSLAKVKALTEISDKAGTATAGRTNSDGQAKFIDGQSSYQHSETWDEEMVAVDWVHMLIDGERWRFLYAEQTVLLKDPVSTWPYATGAAFPVAHRWAGYSLYDLLRFTQDNATNAMRQLNDNMNHANNQRGVADPGEMNWESATESAPGRWIQSKNPMNHSMITVPDITSNSLQFLNYLDDVAGRQAGAALDMATAEAQSLKDISGLSVEMQLGPKEMLASQIGKCLSETLIRGVFLLIHRSLREDFRGTITYRKTDQWITADPSEWVPRSRINIMVGLSPGDRRRHSASLQQVINYQMQFIQGGAANIATSYKGIHSALQDWMAASEIDGAEGYFLDPDGQESQQGQQAAQQQAQQGQAMQQQMAAMQQQMAEASIKLDKYKHDSDLRFDYVELAQKAEISEAELIADGIKAEINQVAAPEGSPGNGGDR
jgi:hypothetical protein